MIYYDHPKSIADQLAEEFGVSVRTIYRDVASLSAAGVPIFHASCCRS